jgi:pimeloyl-ACP methyl ester carboxylesterase
MLFEEKSQTNNAPSTVELAALSRRTLVKRLGAATLAGGLALTVSPLLALADDKDADRSARQPSGINVLLVHGAFADASSWSKVIPLLQREGHNVLAVQLPLTSLSDDVAITKNALAFLAGPTVLAGHSYGGAVISGAAYGAANAVGLVFASAYAPDKGETLLDLNGLYPPTEAGSHIGPSYRDGFAWIDPAFLPQVFAADVAPAEARVLAVTQKPISFNCFFEQAGEPAWKTRPSWYLVSKNDKTINPDLERFLAKRMKATTLEVASSHVSPVSHPLAVFGLIAAAIKQYQK